METFPNFVDGLNVQSPFAPESNLSHQGTANSEDVDHGPFYQAIDPIETTMRYYTKYFNSIIETSQGKMNAQMSVTDRDSDHSQKGLEYSNSTVSRHDLNVEALHKDGARQDLNNTNTKKYEETTKAVPEVLFLGRYCNEGDNRLDGRLLAALFIKDIYELAQVKQVPGGISEDESGLIMSLQAPISWTHLFGPALPADSTMFY